MSDRRPANPKSCKHADSLIVQRNLGHRWVTCTECHTDFLPAPPAGWEPCATCEGSGNFEILNSGFEAEPCLDCANGFVPPAHQVEAAMKVIYQGTYQRHRDRQALLDHTKAALVAAAKARRE